MSTTTINPQLEQAAHYREQGWWGDSTLPGLVDRWADEDPGHAYLSDGRSTYTYGGFRDAAWNLAAGLRQLGAPSRWSRPGCSAGSTPRRWPRRSPAPRPR